MMGYDFIGSKITIKIEDAQTLSVCMLEHRYILKNTVARMDFAPSCALIYFFTEQKKPCSIYLSAFLF